MFKNGVAKTWLSPSEWYGRPVRTRTADLYRVNTSRVGRRVEKRAADTVAIKAEP